MLGVSSFRSCVCEFAWGGVRDFPANLDRAAAVITGAWPPSQAAPEGDGNMGGCISVVLMLVTAITAGVFLAIAAFGAFLLVMLALAIVFLVRYAMNKRKGVRKGWQLVLGIVCSAVVVLGAVALAAGYYVLSAEDTKDVEYTAPDGSTVSGTLTKSQIDSFVRAIDDDDVDTVSEMLDENPALMGIETTEELSPLEEAADANAVNVARYLLENGATIDAEDELGRSTVSKCLHRAMLYMSGQQAAGIEITESPVSMEMVDLLLEYGSDPNGYSGAMPAVQLLIEDCCVGGVLTNDEVATITRFVEAGANLQATNGEGLDAAEFFEEQVDEQGLEAGSPTQVAQVRALLAS